MRRRTRIGLLLVWTLVPFGCSRCTAPPAPAPPPVITAREAATIAGPDAGPIPDAGPTDAGEGLSLDAGAEVADSGTRPEVATDGFHRTKPGQTIGPVWLEGGRLSTWLERETCAEERCPVDVVLYDAAEELGRIRIGSGLNGTIEPCRQTKWCWNLHDAKTEEDVESWVSVWCRPFRWKAPNREGILCSLEMEEETGDAFPAPDYTLVTTTEPPFKLIKAWARASSDYQGIIGASVRETGDGSDEVVFMQRPLPKENEEVSIISVGIFNANEDGTALIESRPRFAIDVSAVRSGCKWLNSNPDVLWVNGARFPPLEAKETFAMLALRRSQAEAWKKQIDACGKAATIVELK